MISVTQLSRLTVLDLLLPWVGQRLTADKISAANVWKGLGSKAII